ncbi:MAG: plasmid stabilization protein ParE [Rhodospirillales bacterium]|jgi:toxin ParE1/3/4|uniref:type II toxin-antitoxin system RelE/ParE family toxin n=1 Tax=Hwanghaeella sp. 1Z406 TaxID=3402811 RepID=UPI000C8DD3A0|nr:plasmid stabilization protein ParE [Rhodospirillales bacterium]MBB58498.1 plasmid stabilization protein ParE [Rhodospirillaceae bacterium]|tara:strand:+ start:1061 stop:1381 length:321 start_codon:yes stop_codon:yes gene_type:complete
MGPKRPNRYRLTPRAREDLEAIWIYTATAWSADQAENYVNNLTQTFQLLLYAPEIARLRAELNPPVRIYSTGSHYILYQIADEDLVVIRILGEKQDWTKILRALDT